MQIGGGKNGSSLPPPRVHLFSFGLPSHYEYDSFTLKPQTHIHHQFEKIVCIATPIHSPDISVIVKMF